VSLFAFSAAPLSTILKLRTLASLHSFIASNKWNLSRLEEPDWLATIFAFDRTVFIEEDQKTLDNYLSLGLEANETNSKSQQLPT
jgi:hypothetical protein